MLLPRYIFDYLIWLKDGMVIEYLPFFISKCSRLLKRHVRRSHFLLVLNEMILSAEFCSVHVPLNGRSNFIVLLS